MLPGGLTCRKSALSRTAAARIILQRLTVAREHPLAGEHPLAARMARVAI
jgi:hypothetical protein